MIWPNIYIHYQSLVQWSEYDDTLKEESIVSGMS